MKQISLFFGCSISLFLGLVLFVYSIDPYDKFGFNFFNIETKSVAMSRENKFNMIEFGKKEYEAFVLGSSAAHRIHTDDVFKASGLKAFNYSVQHSSPEDYLAQTRHILQRQKPKLIMLQIDFDSLNEFYATDTRFYTSPLARYLSKSEVIPKSSLFLLDPDYVSLRAISDSFKVVWVNYFKKARHLYKEDGNYKDEKLVVEPIKYVVLGALKFKISTARVKYLHDIKNLCRDNNIRLIVLTTPLPYQTMHDILKIPSQRKAYEEYLSTLKGIFPDLYDLSSISTPEHNTTEYFQDSYHPNRLMFQIVLKKIFDQKNSETQYSL